MDETRIPKQVERIILLNPEAPQTLFKRVAKEKDKKMNRFRKSVKDAAMAMAEVPRRGAEAILEKMPGEKDGDMFEMFGNSMRRFRKRGMRMLRGKA
jgi:hypothetical protein